MRPEEPCPFPSRLIKSPGGVAGRARFVASLVSMDAAMAVDRLRLRYHKEQTFLVAVVLEQQSFRKREMLDKQMSAIQKGTAQVNRIWPATVGETTQ